MPFLHLYDQEVELRPTPFPQPCGSKASELVSAGYTWDDNYGCWFGRNYEEDGDMLYANGTPVPRSAPSVH
jgi:hypothetical protein